MASLFGFETNPSLLRTMTLKLFSIGFKPSGHPQPIVFGVR